jgi:hypothetical protein
MVFLSIQRQADWRFKARCNFTALPSKSARKRIVSISTALINKSARKKKVSIVLCSHRFGLYLYAGAGPQGLMAGSGPGVLEIKCPFNRGRPTAAAPPKQPPWYYMPQVCHLFTYHLYAVDHRLRQISFSLLAINGTERVPLLMV